MAEAVAPETRLLGSVDTSWTRGLALPGRALHRLSFDGDRIPRVVPPAG